MKHNHKTRKRQRLERLVLCALMGLFGLAVMALFSPAWADAGKGGKIDRHKTGADVGCGDTIGPYETVTLDHDILDCDPDKDGWALRVNGPATLNLNGHRVTHTTESNYQKEIGIEVTGPNAKVLNGIVIGFKWGFEVEGDGNNLSKNISAYNKKGYTIDGDRNRLDGNWAFNNTKENYQIRGDKNWLVDNGAYGGDEECFLIDGGSMNWLMNNVASIGGSGFVVQGEDGVPGAGGNYNKIWNCTAMGNAGESEDDGVGILAREGTNGNLIFHNTVYLNELYDVQDLNVNCGTNKWSKNNFGTSSNQDCIR